jgi:hypothetical protein
MNVQTIFCTNDNVRSDQTKHHSIPTSLTHETANDLLDELPARSFGSATFTGMESDLHRQDPSIYPVTERPWFRLLTKKSRAGPNLGTSSIPCLDCPRLCMTVLVNVMLVESIHHQHFPHSFACVVPFIVRAKAERIPPILHGLCQQLDFSRLSRQISSAFRRSISCAVGAGTVPMMNAKRCHAATSNSIVESLTSRTETSSCWDSGSANYGRGRRRRSPPLARIF